MPTSATGRADEAPILRRYAEHGFTPVRRYAEHGFTLVELLIVVTILGLLSAAVVIAMPDSRGSMRGEAERFAARAKAARDRAVIEARPMAIIVEPDGYVLQRRRGLRWERLEPLPWGEDVAAAGEGMIVVDPTGIVDPAEVVLSRDGVQAAVSIRADGSIRVRS